MTFTYNAAALAFSPRNRVRLLIGDTNTLDQQLQDEEIDFVLSVQTVLTYAAASSADLIAAKYARKVNTENSELRISAAAQHKHYLDLANRLRRDGPGLIPGGDGSGSQQAGLYVGGAIRSQRDALAENDAYVDPVFALGQDDYPGSTGEI